MGVTLLAIDPGLDRTGVAFFDVAAFRDGGGTSGAVPGAFLGSGTVRTDKRYDDAHRLKMLLRGLVELCVEYEPAFAVVEQPAIAGTYSRTGKGARFNLNRFYQARGVVLAACGEWANTVIEARAGGMSKDERATHLESVWKAAGLEPPGSNKDERDAVFVGYTALTTGTLETAAPTPLKATEGSATDEG